MKNSISLHSLFGGSLKAWGRLDKEKAEAEANDEATWGV